jgi:hypothetical protein
MNVKKKIALYTIITGNYDSCIRDSNPLKKMPMLDSAYFVTDSEELKLDAHSKGWKTIMVDKHQNAKKQQREMKILQNFHPDLKILNDYDILIYHDGHNGLCTLEKLETALSNTEKYDVVCFDHPVRKSSNTELDFIKHLGLVSEDAYNKVKEVYTKNNYPDNAGLAETRVLLRKTESYMRTFCEEWINNMKNTNSFRDQTFFEYALWKHNVNVLRMKHEDFPFDKKGKHMDPHNMRKNTT